MWISERVMRRGDVVSEWVIWAFTGILIAWLLAAIAALSLCLARKVPHNGLPLGAFLTTAAIIEALAAT